MLIQLIGGNKAANHLGHNDLAGVRGILSDLSSRSRLQIFREFQSLRSSDIDAGVDHEGLNRIKSQWILEDAARFCEELLHGAINLGSITGAAGHGRDSAGGFFDDVIKIFLLVGMGPVVKASARHEQAMDFSERNILA